MTEFCSDIDLERFADGECPSDETALIRQHMGQCEACSAELEELRKFNHLLRVNMCAETAPPDLRRSVLACLEDDPACAAPAAGLPGMTRRRFAVAAFGAVAAGAAAVMVAPAIMGLRPGPERFASTLISDYQTFLSAERALDYADGDARRVAGWFRARLSFALPELPMEIGDNRLAGGRLCWLFNRRLAALSFEGAEGPFALYVMQADGLDLPLGPDVAAHRRDRITNLVWRQDGLAIGLVGEADAGRMRKLAEILAAGMNPNS